MVDLFKRYMTIEVTLMTGGMDFSCWLSAEQFWKSETHRFPHVYTYASDRCTWFMHSNIELTNKIISMAGEEADRICLDIIATNKNRRIANR